MGLIRSVSIFRRLDHVNSRLELRDERTFWRTIVKILLPIYTSFAFVDAATTGAPLWSFLLMRMTMVTIAATGYILLRGRVHYGVRQLIFTAPWVFGVEYTMIHYGLTLSPYFCGFALILFASTIFFPTRLKVALPQYMICISPLLVWYAIHPYADRASTLNVVLMAIGTVGVCAVNASQLNRDIRKRLLAQEALSRDLGKRQKEVWEQAIEIVRRKAFESQFSPQVVNAVLQQGSAALEMRQRNIVVVVIDVTGSTAKATLLEPLAYKEVIEEVFDVFISACLRWNVTIDKFTGDGAQAFAGAPVSGVDDANRALLAARDTLQMLGVRSFNLRRRWKELLRVRIAICEGPALVGFLGMGRLKSYTALGDTVSLTHRICSVTDPGTITAFSRIHGRPIDPPEIGWQVETREVFGLKGFEQQRFRVNVMMPERDHPARALLVDNGRCRTCYTPLILEETPAGMPVLVCPGCVNRNAEAA